PAQGFVTPAGAAATAGALGASGWTVPAPAVQTARHTQTIGGHFAIVPDTLDIIASRRARPTRPGLVRRCPKVDHSGRWVRFFLRKSIVTMRDAARHTADGTDARYSRTDFNRCTPKSRSVRSMSTTSPPATYSINAANDFCIGSSA